MRSWYTVGVQKSVRSLRITEFVDAFFKAVAVLGIKVTMRYIDPHIHMVSRTTDDYQRMAQSGCIAVTEPAFWAGFDRSSAQGFADYFRQLTEYEPRRAALYGIKHFTWLCINPKEADDPGFAREVISLIPDFLKCDGDWRNWTQQEHQE